jgi:uncharacterized protein YukE
VRGADVPGGVIELEPAATIAPFHQRGGSPGPPRNPREGTQVANTPNLQTNDASVSRILASLQTQIESMGRAAQGVEDVNNEIRQHFKAAASTAYQAKIDDWQAQYRSVTKAYGHLAEKLQGGHHEIDSAHDHSVNVVGGWSTDVYNGLNG